MLATFVVEARVTITAAFCAALVEMLGAAVGFPPPPVVPPPPPHPCKRARHINTIASPPFGLISSLSLPDPWVGHRVQQVRCEIYRNIRQSNRQNTTLHKIVIATADRSDREPANARPGKDRFGYDGAREQRTEL